MPSQDIQKRREAQTRYRATHKEKLKRYGRQYKKAHKKRTRIYKAAYWKKNKKRIKKYAAGWRLKLKLTVFDHYGGKCACCGERETKFLCLDHIRGGGCRHRREIHKGGGVGFYSWIRKHDFPKGFRVLCHNCNLAIGFFGSCPHQST